MSRDNVSSVLAVGGLLFAGTDLQRSAGVDDDRERLREAILDAGKRNDPWVVEAYVRHQLAAYRWLVGKGLRFSLAPPNTNVPVPRLHVVEGDFVTELHGELERASGVTYRPGVPADRLVRRPDGRVRGVRVTGGAVIRARRGVVLTTGGFSRSAELLETFAPRLADAEKMGGVGNTGDGLRMATALGARLADMGYLEPTFGASTRNPPRLLFAHAEGAVIVNRDGERFADESLSYKVLGGLCAEQPAGLAFQVFDGTVMARSQPSRLRVTTSARSPTGWSSRRTPSGNSPNGSGSWRTHWKRRSTGTTRSCEWVRTWTSAVRSVSTSVRAVWWRATLLWLCVPSGADGDVLRRWG